MPTTTLLFQYDGHGDAAGAVVLRRLDLIVLSAPLVLLDRGIVAFLLGLMVWCAEKAEGLLRGLLVWRRLRIAGVERKGGGESGWRGWWGWEGRVDKDGGSLSKVLWKMLEDDRYTLTNVRHILVY